MHKISSPSSYRFFSFLKIVLPSFSKSSDYPIAFFPNSLEYQLFLKKGYEVRSIDNLSSGNTKNIEHLKNNKFFKLEIADLLNLGKFKNFIKEYQQGGDFYDSYMPVDMSRYQYGGQRLNEVEVSDEMIQKLIAAGADIEYL